MTLPKWRLSSWARLQVKSLKPEPVPRQGLGNSAGLWAIRQGFRQFGGALGNNAAQALGFTANRFAVKPPGTGDRRVCGLRALGSRRVGSRTPGP
jgi:hypothetical protein